MLQKDCCTCVCDSAGVLLDEEYVHAGPISDKTPATQLPAKKAKSKADKSPAFASTKNNVLATAKENTPIASAAAGQTPMDPATEAKKLRQLCRLLRAELAAKVNFCCQKCTPHKLHSMAHTFKQSYSFCTGRSVLVPRNCAGEYLDEAAAMLAGKHDVLLRRAHRDCPALRWPELMRSVSKPLWLSECAPRCWTPCA